jgi:hypothetical protein
MADAPRFAQQALTWAWTLIDLAHVPPERIVVHALEGSDASVRRQLEAMGVRTRACQPFRASHPHCNKLRQLEDEQLQNAEVVVLCDSDTAFVRGIEDVLSPARVRARIVDLPNPPNDVWIRILEAAGPGTSPPLSRTGFGDHTTPSINCNGGLYVLPGQAVRVRATAWPAWAHWLVERPELLPGSQQVHVDQVAFGLAVLELDLPIHALSLDFNVPTHHAVGL